MRPRVITESSNPPEATTDGAPPAGRWQFLWSSWTGRLVALNSLVFVVMCWVDASLLSPSQEALIAFGAKDTGLLIRGEWWRLFSPMFVHVGLIHFGLNMMALVFIGRQIERVVGQVWFLAIYFSSGLVAGVASALLTVGTSAGASGAIFGLIGVGFVIERLTMRAVFKNTGRRLRRGPYTGLVVVNVIIGFILTSGPIRIDNAAHLGGLVGGMLMTYVMLRWQNNRFFQESRGTAYACLACVGLWIGGGGAIASQESYQRARIHFSLQKASSSQSRYEVLSAAVASFPEDPFFRLERGILLYLADEAEPAFEDFDRLDLTSLSELDTLADELERNGRVMEAGRLRVYLAKRRQAQGKP